MYKRTIHEQVDNSDRDHYRIFKESEEEKRECQLLGRFVLRGMKAETIVDILLWTLFAGIKLLDCRFFCVIHVALSIATLGLEVV